MHQHLPQLLLITRVDEVKHAVSSQVKLQWTEMWKYRFFFHASSRDIDGKSSTLINPLATLDSRSVTILSDSLKYLCQAEALVDVLGDVDHVSIFGEHH